MFKVGICSVTCRKLTVEDVIKVAKEAKIHGIEWGGDIHVPPGDFWQADRVGMLTRDADLEVISYGSYYRLGSSENQASFETILKTALALGASGIRVWAGTKGSDIATEADWEFVVYDAKRIADLAKEKNIRIHLEYHGNTLTDTVDAAVELMKKIDHANVSLYWQPALYVTVDERIDSIKKIQPWLSDVHVFHWETTAEGPNMHPFSKGIDDWEKYLANLESKDRVRYLMMEFVKNGTVDQFLADVKVLQSMIN